MRPITVTGLRPLGQAGRDCAVCPACLLDTFLEQSRPWTKEVPPGDSSARPDSLPRAGEWLYGSSCKRYKLWDPEIKECVRCKFHSQRLELSPSSLEPPTPPSTTPPSLSQRTSWIYIAWSSLLECRIKPRASTGLPSQGSRTKLTCPIEVNVLLQLYKEQKQQKLRERDFEMSPSYENWLLGLFKFSQAKCPLTAEKTSSYLNGVFFRSTLHQGLAVLVCANAAHLSCWQRLIA